MGGEYGTEANEEHRASMHGGKFRHIYVESRVLGLERTERMLARFPEAEVIEIRHYKDIFNRRRQDPAVQHKSQNLIIAAKEGRLVYPGAPVCQSFGNAHFFYTSCVMNCVFDCEYCYLKGMYPSGNLVIFVNLEDIFKEIRGLLSQFPVYLCVSYDTDLMAVEGLTGYVEEWARFVRDNPGLSIEVRTKSPRLCTEAIREAMVRSHYILQGYLYSAGLLQLLRQRGIAEDRFGGVYYLFLRGMDAAGRNGVWFDRPGIGCLDALLKLMRKEASW